MSSNKTTDQIRKSDKFVVTDDAGNVQKVIFPHELQSGIPGGLFPGGIGSIGNIQAAGHITASLGFSGSLTRLTDGKSYLVAGNNITITSASNGQVTITSSGGGAGSLDAANGVDNRVATFTDANSLNGEANLTFDGSTLTVAGDTSLNGSVIINESSADKDFRVESNNLASAILVDGGADTVTIGGSSTTFAGYPVESKGTDVKILLTGSVGSMNTSTRGTTLIAGDLHLSGAINKSVTTYSFYQFASPTGDPTNEFHFEWAQGTVDNADPESYNQNNFWQYFPKGGKILSIDARGGFVANFDDNFPSTFQTRMVVALYRFNDAWINSSDNTAHGGYIPIGHVTSSFPSDEIANEGGTREHRATFELSPEYISQNITGSFVIPKKSSITLTYKGIGSAGALQKCIFFVTVEKNL